MFTNMHDQLLVNVPILLRLATQKPLNLYSIDMVPMPFDMETLDGKNNEYTFINNSYPYMAVNEHHYIPLTETQLRMCDKMGSTYYCQNSYVLRQRTQHTCESAIYYKMDAKIITKHCQAKFAANVEFAPKVLDAGETMVLFNLPRPWILLCGQEKQPMEIEFATYKVVDRKEFCECSLTAGSFQLDETLVKYYYTNRFHLAKDNQDEEPMKLNTPRDSGKSFLSKGNKVCFSKENNYRHLVVQATLKVETPSQSLKRIN